MTDSSIGPKQLDVVDGRSSSAKSLREELVERSRIQQRYSIDEVLRAAVQLLEKLELTHGTTYHGNVSLETVFRLPDGSLTMTAPAALGPVPVDPAALRKIQRDDQRMLAAILYEMLTGSVPSAECVPAQQIRKTVPLPLSNALQRAMHPLPEKRFADVRAFRKALTTSGNRIAGNEGLLAAGISVVAVLLLVWISWKMWPLNSATSKADLARQLGQIEAQQQLVEKMESRILSDATTAREELEKWRKEILAAESANKPLQLEYAKQRLAEIEQSSEITVAMGEIWTRHQAKDKWRTTAAGLLAAAKSHVEDGSPDAAMKEMEEASLLWQKSTVWKQNARTALELARTTSGDLKRQQSESSDSVPWAYSSTAKLLNGLQSRLAEGDGQQALADVNQAKSDLPAIEQIISRHKEVLRIDDTLTPLDQIHEARVERQNQRKFLSDADEHLRAGRLPECSAGLTQVEKNLAEIPVIALRALSRASEQSLKVQQADKTLQLIEQALAIVTDHQDAPLIKSECLVVRANLNSREGDFGHAITDCEESLLLQPSVSAHVLLASIYNATEKFDAALAESEAAILLDADSPEALNQRGYAHYRKAEFNEALRDFESTLKLSGDFADAITNRGLVCFDQGDYVKALADFDHALRLQPDDVQALVGRAGISRLNGEYRRAIQDCDKALAIHSGFSDALVCRGAAKLGMGDAESAIVDLKNAVTLNPDDLAAHIFLATAWNQKHEWQSAVEECGSALRRGITSAIRRVYQAQRLCFCGS